MTALTQTAANVAIGSSTTKTKIVQYGESVTQGMPLYQSTADSKYYQSDADVEATAIAHVIALTPGSADAYGVVAIPATEPGKSSVNLGATLTVGETYCVSVTKGGIEPIGDLLSGDFTTILGIATTTALMDFQIVIGNTAKA